jgi:hypothetical protein
MESISNVQQSDIPSFILPIEYLQSHNIVISYLQTVFAPHAPRLYSAVSLSTGSGVEFCESRESRWHSGRRECCLSGAPLDFFPSTLRLYTRIRITQTFGLDDGEHALFSPRTLCFWLMNDSFMFFRNGKALLQMTHFLILDCLMNLCTRRAL